MPFSHVKLYNFRNIDSQKLLVRNEQVFFVGENGQGKTNFLESLYLLSYGRSFRSHKDEVMIKNGQNEMSVIGNYINAGTSVETEISVKWTAGKKEILLNGNSVQDRKELIENIPCIVFSHEDIEFVKGSPDQQRWFFNQCLSTYKMGFVDTIRSYSQVLKNRNKIIKNRQFELIELYDQQLVLYGLDIQKERVGLVREFNSLFTPLFAYISGIDTRVEIEYRPSWKQFESDAVVKYLYSRRDNDIHMNTTTSGPHRDKFKFRIDGRDFIFEASTGQIRLMSLILRMAQARLFAKISGKKPILLVDDVLLELDGEKKKKFMAELPVYDQAFFTFLPDENISNYMVSDSCVYIVNAGNYRREKNEKSG